MADNQGQGQAAAGQGQGQGTAGQGQGQGMPGTGQGAAQGQGQDIGPVPYERFKQVNEEMHSLQDKLAQIEVAQKEAAEAKLVEEKRWQDLATQREVELKVERTERLRANVALARGLTPDLAARLQGADEAALAADADKLLAQWRRRRRGQKGRACRLLRGAAAGR